MKKIKTLLVLPGLLCLNAVVAQTTSHLKLSADYPEAGKKVAFTYDPAGTVVDGKKNITGIVYYLDNKNFPAADIELKPDGKLLKGEIAIPENTKAFFIKIAGEAIIDNNNDKGYVYLVYKDKQPVAGAYASEGYMLASGMGAAFAKIKTNVNDGLALIKKEFELHPVSEKEFELGYYTTIARIPEYKAEVDKKLSSLENSGNEKDMMLAVNILRSSRNTKAVDSLNAIIKAKFPEGQAAKNDLMLSFLKEKDIDKKQELYNAYVNKYPENPADKTTSHDNLKVQLSYAYAQKGDMANFSKYESQDIKDKSLLAMYINNVAYEWAQKGEHLEDAAKLSKLSLDIEHENIVNAQGTMYSPPSQVKRNAQNGYNVFADTYAYILYKENKYDEALKYLQPLIDKGQGGDVNEHYALVLGAKGEYAKAKEVAEKNIKKGNASELLKQEYKKYYVKVKGSDAGYDQYLISLTEESKNKLKEELAKKMINTPSPAFTLKDIDGKVVSLSDLKGKTVIVDFWATWCGPCKASFPGMQIAVNKYKDDPNVKFLFVDTWENGDDYVPGVKKFIVDNNYSFHVLLDEKGKDGRQSKVVSSFEVTGIPTKFVIDKNGNIRFKYIGYSGSTDKVVEEVVDMIDMVSNADTASAKASNAKSEGKSK